MEFLSEEWLDAATELVSGQEVLPPGQFTVGYEHRLPTGGTILHTQEWSNGHLDAWRPGPPSDGAVIVCDRDVLVSWMSGAMVGDAQIDIRVGPSETWGLIPTDRDLARTSSKERIHGFCFRAEVRFPDFPLGEQRRTYCWQDGVPTIDPGSDASPDIVLSIPFPGGVGYLLGQVPFRQISSSAQLERGALYSLACLTGLLAPPSSMAEELQGGLRAVSQATSALGAMAALRPTWAVLLEPTDTA